MEEMKVLFLAPQPLCTPQGYDDIYQGKNGFQCTL